MKLSNLGVLVLIASTILVDACAGYDNHLEDHIRSQNEGHKAQRDKDYPKAVSHFQNALVSAEQDGFDEGVVASLRYLGDALDENNDKDAAEKAYLRGLAIAEGKPLAPETVADSHLHLVIFYSKNRRCTEARQAQNKLMDSELAKKSEDFSLTKTVTSDLLRMHCGD